MFNHKLNSSNIIKASTTTLAACVLMACGGESSDSNETQTFKLTEPAMMAHEGKSTYQLNVQDNNGNPLSSVTPMMMPMMDMASGDQHAAPHTGCTETDSEGNADCTVYFLMPSMMNDQKMGDWNLSFSLPESEEKAISFPTTVMMAMNGPAKVKMSSAEDKIASMTMAMPMAMTMDESMPAGEPRPYYIFNNGLSEDNSSIELFVAAKESMMNFPTLIDGLVLNEGSNFELTVDSINVQVSTDNSIWETATSDGKGLWTANGLSGYSNTVYVKLSVNDIVKTNNSDDFASFVSTADAMKDMGDM